MIRFIRILAVFLFLYINGFSQVSYYADSFKGGVTAGGYAPDYDGGGTGTINVYIEPGSAIRKAFLFAGRQGPADTLTVTLNGTPLLFNSANQVSPTFQSVDYGGNSAVHAIDVTSVVSASVTSYTLGVPYQTGPSDRFTDYYLFITYTNASLTTISTEFFVNNMDFGPDVNYTFNLTTPVNSTQPVAVGLDFGYECSSGDADEAYLNGTDLGSIYGPEANSGSCEGPCANFYYQNNAAYGLSGNDSDQAMNGPDVLSDAEQLIANNSTSFTMEFTHSDPDNAHWGFFIVSGGGCSSPIAGVVPNDTAFCAGDFAQLNASGGSTYEWSPGEGLSDSTIFDPFALPAATTTYTVTVSNGCGSSTSTVHIVVYPAPPTPNILQSNDTLYCSIDPIYKSYQWYFNDTLIAGATETSYFAGNSGNYNIAVKDSNGCEISVGINIVTAVQQYYSDHSVFIFPNPAGDKFTVYGLQFTVERMDIYNILGQVCQQSEITNPKSEMDISSLSSGIYFVQVTGEKERWVGKFVKE